MMTCCWSVDKDKPAHEIIEQAAALIKAGGLVAFPTETVYGLGADAFNPKAVRRIYEVKGRSWQNPLLVHISRLEQVYGLVEAVSPLAHSLMDEFWPGPLSIILPKSPLLPVEVTGGQPTVGLRMPRHKVALALIDKAGPLAATSANRSGRPSPVTATHVCDDLKGDIAAILDAGATGIGLESTLIDLSQAKPVVLRTGGVPLAELQGFLDAPIDVVNNGGASYRTAQLGIKLCANRQDWGQVLSAGPSVDTALVYYDDYHSQGLMSGWIAYKLELKGQSTGLFTIIRDAEKRGLSRLVFAPLPADLSGLGGALAERIKRAAGLL